MRIEIGPELLGLLLVVGSISSSKAVLRLSANEVHGFVFEVELSEETVHMELSKLESSLVVCFLLNPDCLSFGGVDSTVLDKLTDIIDWEGGYLFNT
jgi:hypothetical protein